MHLDRNRERYQWKRWQNCPELVAICVRNVLRTENWGKRGKCVENADKTDKMRTISEKRAGGELAPLGPSERKLLYVDAKW